MDGEGNFDGLDDADIWVVSVGILDDDDSGGSSVVDDGKIWDV